MIQEGSITEESPVKELEASKKDTEYFDINDLPEINQEQKKRRTQLSWQLSIKFKAKPGQGCGFAVKTRGCKESARQSY